MILGEDVNLRKQILKYQSHLEVARKEHLQLNLILQKINGHRAKYTVLRAANDAKTGGISAELKRAKSGNDSMRAETAVSMESESQLLFVGINLQGQGPEVLHRSTREPIEEAG